MAPTGTPSARTTTAATPASTGSGAPPERPRQHEPRRAGTDARAPALAARRALAEEQDRPEEDEDEREGTARRGVEADRELGVRLGGQGAEAEDLEGAELGQADQGDEHRSRRGWPVGPGRPSPSRTSAGARGRGCAPPLLAPGRRCACWRRPGGRRAGRRPGSSPARRPRSRRRPGRWPASRSSRRSPGCRAGRRPAPPTCAGPAESVRSTNQASSVPSTAHSTVTTTVRLTVFQSNWAVRLRKSSGSRVDQPVWKAWTSRKTSGVRTATATRAASARRAGGAGDGVPAGVVVEVVPQPRPSAVPVPAWPRPCGPCRPPLSCSWRCPSRCLAAPPRALRLAFLPGHVAERPPCSSHRAAAVTTAAPPAAA